MIKVKTSMNYINYSGGGSEMCSFMSNFLLSLPI